MRKLFNPILMWIIVAMGSISSLLTIDNHYLFKSGYTGVVTIVVAFIFWLYIFISSINAHRQFIKSAHNIDTLITTGIYAKVRHPIYLADIILSWAFFILFSRLDILFGVIWLNLVLFFWSKFEEKVLTVKFGQQYLDYKNTTSWIKFW